MDENVRQCVAYQFILHILYQTINVAMTKRFQPNYHTHYDRCQIRDFSFVSPCDDNGGEPIREHERSSWAQ